MRARFTCIKVRCARAPIPRVTFSGQTFLLGAKSNPRKGWAAQRAVHYLLRVMTIRLHSLSSALMVAAALMGLFDTLCFASQRPDYSHITNTISELGETGASHARQVAFGFFLPVGLLVWLSLWLVHREASDRHASLMLLAMSCLGTGYVMAAFFPCDPGSPLFGSWRQQVHNVFGFIEYEGTGIGFLLVSRYLARQNTTAQAVAFLVAGALVLLCLALLSFEGAFHVRGAIQRVAEITMFIGVLSTCSLLPRRQCFLTRG
jgi:hypothetical protein